MISADIPKTTHRGISKAESYRKIVLQIAKYKWVCYDKTENNVESGLVLVFRGDMMLLFLYLTPLIVLSVILRKASEGIRRVIRIAYSFLFLLGIQGITRLMTVYHPQADKVFEIFGASIYTTVQSITFTGTMAWAEGAELSNFVRGQIWLIAFVASVITLHSVVATVFGKFLNQLDMKVRGGFKKEQYIILGDTESARVLIVDIFKNVKRPYIIFIPTDIIRNDDPLFLRCRVEKQRFLEKISKKKTYHIVLLADNEYSNLERVDTLNKSGNDQLHVTVFLNNDVVRYHDLYADKIDTCITSVDQILVEHFLTQSCPFSLLKEKDVFAKNGLPYLKKPFGICVIGFGKIGQEFLLRCYETSSFLTEDGSPSFNALVVDRYAKVLEQEFVNNTPFFSENKEVEFLQTEVDSALYFGAIKDRLSGLDQIVIAIGDTQQNVDTALSLCRFFDRLECYEDRPQIVVILSNSVAGVESLFRSYPNVKMMDFNTSIFNYAYLIEAKIDSVAKEINDGYNRRSGRGKKWNELGTYLQAMNRAAVFDIRLKKELYQMCDAAEEERIEFLARYEHQRWCAFNYTHGWKRLPIDELTKEEKENYISKRVQKKQHACLIPWDDLDDLPQKNKGDYKSYDVANVRQALEYRSQHASPNE